MPDFRVVATGSPALSSEVWVDPASVDRPSRIVGVNDRQFRQIKAQLGTTLTLTAILNTDTAPQQNGIVGFFSMWPIEYPTAGGQPGHSIPVASISAVQEFYLNAPGHYTFAVRHEDTDAFGGGGGDDQRAGGAVVLHIEVTP